MCAPTFKYEDLIEFKNAAIEVAYRELLRQGQGIKIYLYKNTILRYSNKCAPQEYLCCGT